MILLRNMCAWHLQHTLFCLDESSRHHVCWLRVFLCQTESPIMRMQCCFHITWLCTEGFVRLVESVNSEELIRYQKPQPISAARHISANNQAPSIRDDFEGSPARGKVCLPKQTCFITVFNGGRTHFIIVMIRWTGLVPWEFEFPCVADVLHVGGGRDIRHARHARVCLRRHVRPPRNPS